MKQNEQSEKAEERAKLTQLKVLYEAKLLNIKKQIEQIDNEK